jgi:hypothetical protein
MPQVRLSDGTSLLMPDHPTPDDLAALEEAERIASQRGPSMGPIGGAPPREAAAQTRADLAKLESGDEARMDSPGARRLKVLGGGLQRGAAFVPALFSDMFRTMSTDPRSGRPTADVPGLESLSTLGTQPTTAGERYLAALGEGVAGAATPLGIATGGPFRTGIIGGATGVGAQAGAEVDPGNPLSPLIGALMGAAGGTAATSRFGNTADLARATLRGVSPDELRAAQQFMQQARGEGVDLNLSQAMPRGSGIDQLVETLAQSQYGPNVFRQLDQQPRQVADLTRRTGQRLPGQVVSDQQAANKAQEATSKAIKEAKEARTAQTRPIFEQADMATVPPERLRAVDAELVRLRDEVPNTGLAEMYEGLRAGLRDPRAFGRATSTIGDISEAADEDLLTNVGELNRMLRSQGAQIGVPQLRGKALEAEEAKEFRKAIKLVRDELYDASPDLRKAYDLHAKISREQINPLLKSSVGRVAQRGATEIDEATQGRAFQIFDRGQSPNASGSDIRDLYVAMNKADPQAFPTVAKTWIDKKLTSAIKQKQGRPASEVAESIEQAFVGDERKRTALREVLRGVGQAQGLSDPDALATGFEKFLRITAAAGRRPANVRAMSESEGREVASESLISNVVRLWGFLPIERGASGLERFHAGRSYEALDRMLSSPEGVDKLIELAAEPVMGRKAQALAASLVGGAVGATDRIEDDANAIQR